MTACETAGFMKALVEALGDRILGFTMIGSDAGEVVACVQTAMLGGLPYTLLRDAEQTFARAYGATPGMAVLVRPDGYVGLLASAPDAEAIRSYVQRVLGPQTAAA